MNKFENTTFKKVRYSANIYEQVSSIKKLLYENLKISKKLDVEMYMLAIIQRAFSGYDAVNLLISEGHYLESIMVIRSLFESYFIFNGLFDNPEETVRLLEVLSKSNRTKAIKAAGKYKQYDKHLENIDKKKLLNEQVGIYKFAKLSDANNQVYDIPYKMISNIVHINQRSLMNQIQFREDQYEAMYNIDPKDIEASYFTMFYCIQCFFSKANIYFKLQLDDEVNKVVSLLNEIYENNEISKG